MNKKLQFLFSLSFLLVCSISFAQPANDDCANASVIIEGNAQAFTTIDATTDGAAHANDCVSSGTTPDSTFNDVWYSYTASFTGEAEWSCWSTADFDTKIFVYGPGATCPPTDADIIGCNEDAGGCDNSTSIAIFDVVMGETYLLRVGGYGDGGPGESGSGTFSLNEFISNAPPNDDCANAEVIMVGTDIPITNVDATTDGPEHPGNPCFGFGDNTIQTDVWYTFTAPSSGFFEWTSCNSVNFDSRLGVYYGGTCPFTDADLIECNDDGGGCLSYTSSVTFEAVMGETYYLRIGGYNGETGIGTMDLIEIIPPTPPANDLCTDKQTVMVVSPNDADNGLGEVSGSTIAGGFDNNSFLFPKCITNTNGGEFSDVWFSFDPQGLEEIEVQFLALTENSEFFFDLWEDCDSLAYEPVTDDCHYIDYATTPFYIDTIRNIPTNQSEYYIRVTTRLTSDLPGDFVFQLVGDVPDIVSTDEVVFNDFKFYPNPVTEEAQLEFELSNAYDIQIEIVDILGQTVYLDDRGKMPSGKHNFSLNLDDYAQGIYILSVRSNDLVKSMKFIKE